MRIDATAHGRINIIGDHTDYTGGFVLPMTIEASTIVSGVLDDVDRWDLTSDDEPDRVEITSAVDDPSSVRPDWGRYVAGVLDEIRRSGRSVPGFRGHVSTSLPIGSGLSSSAALEIAVARIALHDDTIEPRELALLCQRAEHRASGVPCGIMDQLCIAAGTPNVPLLIDCESLLVESVELPDSVHVTYEFVTPRRLAGSEYSTRVSQARTATDLLGPLRDADPRDVESIDDPILRRRARHIVTENRRVLDFVSVARAGDVDTMGRLMIESHRSMRYDYETSNDVMDAAVDRTLAEPDVLGARLTGGGFGGCVVALRRR